MKVNLATKFAQFPDHWRPKIVGELNGRMELRDRDVWIEQGEFIVGPRGTEHRPVAEEEAHVLLFEPATPLNTGNVTGELTARHLERI